MFGKKTDKNAKGSMMSQGSKAKASSSASNSLNKKPSAKGCGCDEGTRKS